MGRMTTTPAIGQRVSVVFYGERQTGTVERVGRRIVWVRMDQSGVRHWHYPESLTVIEQ